MNDMDICRKYFMGKQVMTKQGKPKKRKSAIGAGTAHKNDLHRKFANGGIPPRMSVKRHLTDGLRRFE